ncbi:hypothetical protein BS78_02G307200 [Paspalum vaginatum]|nr:hypothetical protein BS78_02G307200 [Paspalum vaginatum]
MAEEKGRRARSDGDKAQEEKGKRAVTEELSKRKSISVPHISIHGKRLLEQILVRIASPIDLVRVSTACVSFHRLITDPIFLRRYRSLHPPLILGTIKCDDDGGSSSEVFQPPAAPHPSAPAGRSMASAADFSLDYVPGSPGPAGEQLPDLFVCDPLYRRYLLLRPPIPDGQVHAQDLEFDDAFFVPRADEDDDEASFRVAMEIHSTTGLSVFIYSSGSGSWSAGASNSWDTLGFGEPALFSDWASYAYGCIYWQVRYSNELVELDMNRMEFSSVDLPLGLLGHHDEDQASMLIFEEPGSNGRLGMIFVHVMHDGTSSLRYYTSVQNDEDMGANGWQMKGEIPLPVAHFTPNLCSCQHRRFVFLEGSLFIDVQGMCVSACSALDIETMEIERVSHIRSPEDSLYDFLPYVGFPPSMSPRRI